jgi:hypothetical protein
LANPNALLKRLGPQVRGHDDHGVAEVRQPARRVGQPALAEHLEEQVEKQRVGLLELVQQEDQERLLSDLGGQHPLAAHGAADEPLHRLGVGVFTHVQAGQPLRIAEEELGQRLGHFGFAHAGRADEEERGDGPARPGQAGLDGGEQVHDQIDRLGLPEHTPSEPAAGFVQVEPGRILEQH